MVLFPLGLVSTRRRTSPVCYSQQVPRSIPVALAAADGLCSESRSDLDRGRSAQRGREEMS